MGLAELDEDRSECPPPTLGQLGGLPQRGPLLLRKAITSEAAAAETASARNCSGICRARCGSKADCPSCWPRRRGAGFLRRGKHIGQLGAVDLHLGGRTFEMANRLLCNIASFLRRSDQCVEGGKFLPNLVCEKLSICRCPPNTSLAG
jgi:hypothetical protein